jgi:site-specific recombinase XerD
MLRILLSTSGQTVSGQTGGVTEEEIMRVKAIPERNQRETIWTSMAKTTNPSTGSGAMLAKLLGTGKMQGAEKEMKMKEWVRLSGNVNTRRTYDSGFRGFTRYMDEESMSIAQLRPCDIADYLRLRAEEGNVAASTIAGDRAAIGDGLKNTVAKGMHLDPLVKATMKICMNGAAQSKPKQHVSAELMQTLVERLHATVNADWMEQRNVALVLTMMLGMLRESEAVEIRMEDVKVKFSEQAAAAAGDGAAESVSLLIRGSKTDQAKKGVSVMLSANNTDTMMCPVRILSRYVKARTTAGVVTEYLFAKNNGDAMAKSTPCGIIQRLVKEANQTAMRDEGIEEKWGSPELYGSHSLRRGGVTAARASGVEMLEIQRHGRWRSMTVWGYVGPTDAQQKQVTANIFGRGAHKNSMSAPSTPVKPPKSPRKPRASPLKPKRKREGKEEGEDEGEPEVEAAEREAERVDEAIFMESMQQGYDDEDKEKPRKKARNTKWKVEKAAATNAAEAPPRREAAREAKEKMLGRR